MGKKDQLKRVSDTLSLCFIIAVLLTGYEVVSRYVFNAPTTWVHETTIMLVAFGFMLGGVVTLYERTHITINLLTDRLSGMAKSVLNLTASIVSVFYLATVGYGSYVITKQAWMFKETSGTAWNSPMPVILKTLLTLCLALMLLIATYQTIKHTFLLVKQLKAKLTSRFKKEVDYGY
ncbi:TRAP transporter small permease [uncultured Vibrio sp.]|uniref:TRAP transporter small permease subunit n=1 Tax=uncultured Vibrio sp. TaxID=114054 RepID=UPI00260DDF0B|nr:TRAP transporter small permease [uncultured Vibrio sp.]